MQPPVIEANVSAIKYFHSIVGYNIGESTIFKHVLEAIKRIIPHTSHKKEALTVEQLREAVDFLNQEGSLKNMRTKNIMILSFVAFLRYSECQNLRRSDFKIFDEYAMMFIEKSKTDMYRDGHWMFISKLNSELCPIRNLEEYFRFANLDPNSTEFIFRAVKSSSSRQSLRKKEEPISYTTVREDVLATLKAIGLNSTSFGLHSLRSGGASAAANFGVSDRLIQKHGRWKSIGVKNNYISENLHNLLYVSRNLGL